MTGITEISIVGPGKVGTAVGVLAARAGLRVAVGGRRRESADAAAEAMGHDARAAGLAEAAAASDLVLLTVSDGAIESVCEELAESFRPGAVVAHCSGVLDSDVLGAAQTKRGCEIGSMHPFQTFPSVQSAVSELPGAWCFCEGTPAAVTALRALGERLGVRVESIRPGAKGLYHAAAVMACNHLTALLDAASAMADAAGIDEQTARAAMGPIVRATVDNVLSAGPAAALTGPVARGDVRAVETHLKALGQCPAELRDFYRAAAIWTIDLARRKGGIDESQARALRDLLAAHE